MEAAAFFEQASTSILKAMPTPEAHPSQPLPILYSFRRGRLGGDEAHRQDAWDLIARNDGEFKFHLDRYKYPHRYGLAGGVANRELARGFLDLLQDRLALNGFLGGARFGLADAAIAPFVRQFAHTDAAWFAAQTWTQLAQWLQDFKASPAFAQVMEKHPVWSGNAASVA
ncbi:MAG: hypothetical protein EBR89_11645 [Betaproteobacteria bacterium]|nr:hypothetical protein [Betaproteobacteria bacterium]